MNLVVAATHLHYKNAIRLIEAVNSLSEAEKEKLRINWYGKDGNDNSLNESINLIKLYELDDIIKFHKPSNNINNIYSNCDAIGLFSLFEGLPNTVCEGMMTQKPVIASNVSDVSLLINNTQAIFNPKKINEIKDSLIWLIRMNKNQLLDIGSVNRAKANKLFDKNDIIESYLKLLEK